MHKASLKQEYRWEDHLKEPLLTPYEPVKDFDPRFFYYDHYQMITQDLFQSTSVRAEEAKCEDWAILEEELEPGLALDPNSYAAKVKKRKEPPTEADVLSSVRKRPATPPQEAASVEPPTSAVTPQGQVAEVSSSETARTQQRGRQVQFRQCLLRRLHQCNCNPLRSHKQPCQDKGCSRPLLPWMVSHPPQQRRDLLLQLRSKRHKGLNRSHPSKNQAKTLPR